MSSNALRLGMVIPSSNTTVEALTPALLHGLGSVTAHYSRFAANGASMPNLAYTPELSRAAKLLVDADITNIAFNGTAGAWLGLEADEELCKDFKAQGASYVTTATLAVLQVLRRAEVSRIGMVIAGPDTLAGPIRSVLGQVGVEVCRIECLAVRDNRDAARVDHRILSRSLDAVADNADGTVVLGTNLPGAAVAAAASHRLGIPVIDSAVAVVWEMLRCAGREVAHGELLARLEAPVHA
jgi:maleate isomerase